MGLDIKDFRVPDFSSRKDFELADFPTEVAKLYRSKKDYEGILEQNREELAGLQELLYAHDRYSLLLIFQGMDTSGKDGAIKHVMSGVNPQGCQVFSFKRPSAEELDHDFMWRYNKSLPERGRIGIHNRSYYEDVLVVRVNPELLHIAKVPEELITKDIWKERFEDIVNHEEYLTRNGTRVLKFFLNISRDEQRERLLARLDDDAKLWKFDAHDVEQRKHWKAYMEAYEDCLRSTSTRLAPWYVVPGDDKRNARIIVSEIVTSHLRGLDMHYPKVSSAERAELKRMRKHLEND